MNCLNAQSFRVGLRFAVLALSLLGGFILPVRAQLGITPDITVQPLGQTVPEGGTAIFTVEAFSLTTMSYQWYRNSNAIAGATGSTYTRPNVSFPNAGFYHVVIVNFIGSTKSDVVRLTVVSNTVPVGVNDSYIGTEEVPLTIAAPGVLANDTDADGGSVLRALLVTNVTSGTLNLSTNGNFTYTPATNFHGTVSFSYRPRDAVSTGNVTKVNITITPVNDPPVASSDSTNTLEDTSVTVRVLSNDSDPEGAITITSRSTTNGTAVISGTNIVFTPTTNFNGIAVFSYTISDGTNSATANVTVLVTAVNDAPVAVNNAYSTPEDTVLTIPAAGILTNDVDVDSASLTAVLVATPTKGVLNLNANGSFTYTPNLNVNGTDSFTYRAHDGVVNGNLGTVTLNITPVNDLPVANSDSTNTLEDTSVVIPVLRNDTDIEGPLAISSTSTTNGTAVISGTNIVFTPSANYFGSVVFSYVVSDGTNSVSASVSVNVISVNDAPPVASNNAYTTPEDASLVIAAPGVLVNDTDVDNDSFTAELVSSVTHGVLSFNANGSFSYTPDTNYFGSDSFTYRATDSMATGNVATVTITVTPVNDAPLPINDTTNTLEDTSIVIKVLVNDSDIEGTRLTITGTSATNGNATVSGTNIVFTPSTNVNGLAVFSYTVSDGTNSATANVSVTVLPVNDIPVAVDDAVSVLEDKSVTIDVLANDSDVEGAALTVISVSSTNGTAIISGTNVVYTPPANFFGTVLLNYTMSDGAFSATARVTITISSVNDAPVGNEDSYSTQEDVRLTIPAPGVLANDTDIENNSLTVLLGSTVSHGSLTLSGNGAFIYTPATNYFGEDSFTYRVWDGSSNSAYTTVRLTTHLNTPLKIVSAGAVSNGFKLGLVGPTPAAYTIVASGDNVNWTPIGSRVAWNGPVEFTDTNAHRYQNCFYAATVGSQSTIKLEENATGGDKVDLRSDKQGSQSFRHGVVGDPAYTVSKVVVRLSRQTTLPNANLIFTIGTGINSGALPDSTVTINPASISNTSAGNNFQTYEMLFTIPIGPLTAGTTYYLNFEFRPTNGARMYLESSGTDSAYPRGNYYRAGNLEIDDAVFELWGQ